MSDHNSRHHLFARALLRADWNVQELWLAAIASGGTVSVLDLEAFLYGLNSLQPDQQDVLALTLNERLADLYESAKISYLVTPDLPDPPAEDALAVLQRHVRAARDVRPQPPA